MLKINLNFLIMMSKNHKANYGDIMENVKMLRVNYLEKRDKIVRNTKQEEEKKFKVKKKSLMNFMIYNFHFLNSF